MFSRFLSFCCLVLVSSSFAFGTPLKVCADPDNLPFSNRKAQGFDNKISELLAQELGRKLEFVWQRAGRGFVRENLNKGVCDMLVGVPAQFRPVLTTTPYYSSSYVFITRKDRKLKLDSFDDPRLRKMKIGVQVLDDDYAPPARALSRRQLTPNIVGFDTTGEESGDIVRAVAHGKIDVAVVWGPLAGYYAAQQRVPLTVSPVQPELDPPALPFRFAMSVGVRKSDHELKEQLERALVKRHAQIERILRSDSVPQFESPTFESAKQARLK
ncbi:MAG: quinoprotein dehydrogenase-associated putative ABC transporter substrate-binding protein [Candidatus Angelobacter sp.]